MQIHIGSIQKSYRIVETNAPVNYDDFGTFSIHIVNDKRWVAIEQEHYDWQTMRYGSGNRSAKEVVGKDLQHMQRTIEHLLYTRLTGAS